MTLVTLERVDRGLDMQAGDDDWRGGGVFTDGRLQGLEITRPTVRHRPCGGWHRDHARVVTTGAISLVTRCTVLRKLPMTPMTPVAHQGLLCALGLAQ